MVWWRLPGGQWRKGVYIRYGIVSSGKAKGHVVEYPADGEGSYQVDGDESSTTSIRNDSDLMERTVGNLSPLTPIIHDNDTNNIVKIIDLKK